MTDNLEERPSDMGVPLDAVNMGFVPITGLATEVSTDVDDTQKVRSPSTHLVRLIELEQLNQPSLEFINIGCSVIGLWTVVASPSEVPWVVNTVSDLKVNHVLEVL